MASPTQEQNRPIPNGDNEDVVTELQDIITAQEAHIDELSQLYDQLKKRVECLENTAARSTADMKSFEQPGMMRSDKTQNPRRLDPTMMQTLPMTSPRYPTFQTPPVVHQQYRPMSPPQPANYRPPYTESGEEQPGGILPEHTISHAAGFRPINCSCALPHTLENGGTAIPRQGFA